MIKNMNKEYQHMINTKMLQNCDFSYRHYFGILNFAKEKFKIGPIKEFEKLRNEKKFMILRHDVDFSLEYALFLAKNENKIGVRSTYFILLQGNHYNALSIKNVKIIKQIHGLGHEIGLHYDSYLIKSKKLLNSRIRKLSDILENIIGEKVVSIAQDNPSILKGVNARDSSDFLDAMNPDLLKNTTYLSDSGQNWREGCACKHINKINNLYLLIHPIWWSEKSNKREDILQKFQDHDIKKTFNRHKNIQKNLQSYIQKLKDGTIK
jgi:hypothetical protein